jgi:hypothetical protein
MLQLTSPRLPGVPVLQLQYTGPEYSRWRRSIKYALEAKGTWKYCNGKCPMPMPATSPTISSAVLQPSLLEERRDWVKHDREVKLDIFLSLAEEVMLDVFEVGPPLPPSNLNAQEMMEALEDRFAVFRFESYHHAFCHFLNLHIDQFSCIEDFNQEFLITLEDLLDHGHPLSNVQACSAYFSKMRCTQNPWVAKKLEDWEQTGEMGCIELLKEAPPWAIIRPLATKSSQNFSAESIPEEYLEDSSASDSDLPSDKSDASTISSISSHSRHISDIPAETVQPKEVIPERQESVLTTRSQEITIIASPGVMSETKPQATHKQLEQLSTSAIPERGSSKHQVPGTPLCDDPAAPLPEWLVSKKSVARRPVPAPQNRPLPPLPVQAQQNGANESGSHSTSSNISTASKSPSQTSLKLETVHPTLRPSTPTPPTEVHPALRTESSHPTEERAIQPTPLPTIDTTPLSLSFPFPSDYAHRRPSTSSPNIAVPWPSTPDVAPRPHSSRAVLPFSQAPNPMPSFALAQPSTSRPQRHVDEEGEEGEEDEEDEQETSEIFLPLQGTHESAWDYLYEAKGGYLLTQSPTALTHRPTYEDRIILPSKKPRQHKKSASLDFLSRLKGENYEEMERRHRKKQSWSGSVGMNMHFAKFSAGKGVKEII